MKEQPQILQLNGTSKTSTILLPFSENMIKNTKIIENLLIISTIFKSKLIRKRLTRNKLKIKSMHL
jgi:hypothetical protein